jgi:hypothetical protein
MHDIKITNFKREYPTRDFPRFKTLSTAEGDEIRKILVRKLGLPSDSSSLELVNELDEQSFLAPDLNAESDNFDLKSTVLNAGISPQERIFINWYRFDQIDEMDLDDVSEYFDDIWYPAADHIDIFDDSFSWIVSIGYSGEVMTTLFMEN